MFCFLLHFLSQVESWLSQFLFIVQSNTLTFSLFSFFPVLPRVPFPPPPPVISLPLPLFHIISLLFPFLFPIISYFLVFPITISYYYFPSYFLLIPFLFHFFLFLTLLLFPFLFHFSSFYLYLKVFFSRRQSRMLGKHTSLKGRQLRVSRWCLTYLKTLCG